MARIRLTDAAKHYQALPHQAAAFAFLEDETSDAVMQEFEEMYRADPEPKAGSIEAKPYYVLQPLLSLIRAYESRGGGDYCAVNRGRSGDTPGGWPGLTTLTLADVLAAQAAGKLHAAGAYQVIPVTLREVVEKSSLSGDLLFDQYTQDWICVVLLLGGWKRPTLTAYLLGQSDNLAGAQDDLAYEWASIPGADGNGMYDGDSAGNRSNAATAEVRGALMEARRRISSRPLSQLDLQPPGPASAAPPAAPQVTVKSPFSTPLTEHFTLGEFALNQEQRRFQYAYQLQTALELAQFLEKVRAQFGGRPLRITSGYRPPAVNRAVGGSKDSEHLYSAPSVGAVDVFVDGVSVSKVQSWIAENWPYSVGLGAHRGFVHVGVRGGRPRVRWNY